MYVVQLSSQVKKLVLSKEHSLKLDKRVMKLARACVLCMSYEAMRPAELGVDMTESKYGLQVFVEMVVIW